MAADRRNGYGGDERDDESPELPPHNLGAERAVLSAVILSPALLDDTVDLLRPERFYSEAHRRVYEAFLSLRDDNRPIDVETVMGWLKDRNRLEQVGVPYFLEIINGSPAIANVRSHAELVHDTWRRRQLCEATVVYRAEAMVGHKDTQTLCSEAAQRMADIATAGVSTSVQRLGEVVEAAYMRVAEASRRGAAIVGLQTGFERYDRVTGGLNDGELTVVAARPGMGKTSWALGIGVNVASERKVDVVMFSLEMPREQMGARAACMEGRVDMARMRTGMLSPSDWSKLTQAAAFLNGLPMWIDDKPDITVAEVRAKCRKVDNDSRAAGRRLGLVIVDYLQLMKGLSSSQSREEEVSSLSRGLKGLSKELSLPVIALSQLNRALESRSDKHPQLSDLRECIAGDQLVYDPKTGDRVPIRKMAEQCRKWQRTTRSLHCLGLSNDGRGTSGDVIDVWATGLQRTLLVRTRTGRELRCTAHHPLLTYVGWVPAETILVGTAIAVPRTLKLTGPRCRSGDLDAGRARLLGYLISDGSYTKHRSVEFVNLDREVVADASIQAERFGVTPKTKPCVGKAKQVAFVIPGQGKRQNGLLVWLRELGIHGQMDSDKRVPRAVFRSTDAVIADFIGALWAGDGCIKLPYDAHKGCQLTYTSTSRGLLHDLQHLLLRLGIWCSIGRPTRHTKSTKDIATISITDAGQLLRFAKRIPIVGRKGALLAKVREFYQQRRKPPQVQVDLLPVEATARLRAVAAERGLSWGDLGYRVQDGKRMTRKTAHVLAKRHAMPWLLSLACSDVLWDTVVSVTDAGETDTYDFRARPDASASVSDVFVHNSGAIEQDADNVVFIYREEYYRPNKAEDRNIAELNIAKQRNGPTTTVKVRFDPQYTRFDNLAASEYDENASEALRYGS